MFEPRPYQPGAIEFLKRTHRGLVQSPAGSGKTILAAAALAATPHQNAWWVANTKEQSYDQAAAALKVFNTTAHLSCVAGQPDVSQADVLIVDECAHAAAPTWSALIRSAPATCRVWGLSATPFNSDPDHDDAIKEIFPAVYVITREQLGNKIAPALVKMLTVNERDESVKFPKLDAQGKQVMDSHGQPVFTTEWDLIWPDIRRQFSKFPFFGLPEVFWETARTISFETAIASSVDARSRLQRWRAFDIEEQVSRIKFRLAQQRVLVYNRMRNRKVVELATEHSLQEDSVLVLVSSVLHGQAIAARIPGAVCVYSKVGVKKRREAIQGFKDGVIPCLVATSLADEGLDVPRANVLILVSAGRSKGRVEQRTGRVLRAFAGKDMGLIYDFMDVGHYYLHAQSRARVNTYRSLGYTVAFEDCTKKQVP